MGTMLNHNQYNQVSLWWSDHVKFQSFIDYRCCTFVSIHYTMYGILSQPQEHAEKTNRTEIVANYFRYSFSTL